MNIVCVNDNVLIEPFRVIAGIANNSGYMKYSLKN